MAEGPAWQLGQVWLSLVHFPYLGDPVVTVDSSYNSATRHPTSFLGLLNFLKIHSLSLLCVSGTHGAWPLHCTATILDSANIEFHMHVHVYTDWFHLTPPSNHHLRHPSTGPWGCYVHTWNGHVGLWPPLLLVGHLMQPKGGIDVKCVLSPAEQACPYFHSLLSP